MICNQELRISTRLYLNLLYFFIFYHVLFIFCYLFVHLHQQNNYLNVVILPFASTIINGT